MALLCGEKSEERCQLILFGKVSDPTSYPPTCTCLKTVYEPKAPAAECCSIGEELVKQKDQVQWKRQKAGVEVPVKLLS